jgi:hypothetical protein
VAQPFFIRIVRKVFEHQRSWPYKGHFTLEDVEQLWQFIQGSRPKQLPKPGEALRIRNRIHCFAGINTAGSHGSEFIDFKGLFVKPRPLLLKDNRPAQMDTYQQRSQQQYWRQQNNQAKRYDYIQRPFDAATVKATAAHAAVINTGISTAA